jgi:hypothetical protein
LICISAQEKKKEICTKNEKYQKQSTKKKATKGNIPKFIFKKKRKKKGKIKPWG